MKYLAFILLVSTCNQNVVIVIDNVACNDNNGCTEAMATYVNDSLTNCFYQDTCINSDPCEGVDCNDANACTVDTCNDGHCEHSPIQIVCNDNNACTSDFPLWQCPDSVSCVYTPSPCDTFINPCDTLDCDDDNNCTINECDSVMGCIYPDAGLCNDNLPCTQDYCNKSTIVQGYWCINIDLCNDGNECTDDICNAPAGQPIFCTYEGISCNDNDSCTLDDCAIKSGCYYVPNCTVCDTLIFECHIQINCPGNPPHKKPRTHCNDNELCTDDICDPITGDCWNLPVICDAGTGLPYCCVNGICVVPCFGKLLDLSGKEMTANIEDLPTGMYIKHYIDNGILRVQKIIKQ